MRLVLLLKAKTRKTPKRKAVVSSSLHKEKRRNKKGFLVTKLVKNAPAVTGKKHASGSKVLAEKPKRKSKASAAPSVKPAPKKKPTASKTKKPVKPRVSRTRDEDPDSPRPAKGPLNEKLIGKFLDAKNAKESMTISASGDKHYPYRVVNTSENLKEPMHVDDLTESQALNWISGMKPAKK